VTTRTVDSHVKRLRESSAILVNLVDNALKYAVGTTHVRVRGRQVEDTIELAVADDGPGIEQHHHARLFERFYRVDAGRARERGGTGLGLAIVRHLAESMGGKVTVRSEAGRGTTFTLTLPAAQSSSEAPPPRGS
jgi:two-component system phosphate regulon sensor histidine kinase PhoR